MAFNEKYDELQHKGTVLATQALDKLQDGDIGGFKTDWEEANKNFDLFLNYVNSDAGKIEMMFGENLNFGVIYNIIESNSNKIYEDAKQYPKVYKSLINEIKSDKVLKQQFDVYNALTNATNVSDAREYVNEAVSAFPHFSKKEICKSNKKLIDIIRKGKLDEFIYIDDDKMKLYESIEFILLSKSKFNKIGEYINAKNNIVEYVSKHGKTINENIEKDYDETVKELSEKYDKELNDDEKNLIKLIETTENKEKFFNDYKEKTIKSLTENLVKYEGNDKMELENVVEKINRKTYDEKTIIADIAEMIEISNIINED